MEWTVSSLDTTRRNRIGMIGSVVVRITLNDAETEQADVLARYFAMEHPEIGWIHTSYLQ